MKGCVAFTGYRPEKIALSSADPDIEHKIRAALRAAIADMYRGGYRTFLSGMAQGFDLWAAAETLAMAIDPEFCGMELVAVVPFRGQAARYPRSAATAYDDILSRASQTVILSEHYYQGCFTARNDFLIANSSAVICYFDGQDGGTRYTVSKAKKEGLRIFNICNPTLF
jgi:uncharacterized phage-like protein YoqJ